LKNLTAEKTKVTTSPEETKEWINRTLKKIHRKMVELFQVDFTIFSDIKILKHSDLLKHLTQRMRNNLKENGVVYSDIHWKQISKSLSKDQVSRFFENLAFYNPDDEVLYISKTILTNHREKIIPTCTHELSEKLLSTYLSSPPRKPTRTLVEAYIKAKNSNNTRNLLKLLNACTEIIFKSVFKEGACEAIALRTLLNIDSEKTKASSLEKELLTGYSKSIGVLCGLDNEKKDLEYVERIRTRLGKGQKTQVIDEEKFVKETLRSAQVVKGLSYYLSYPLAKAVLERYSIKGVKFALEKYPPLKARYFVNPQSYLAELKNEQNLLEERGEKNGGKRRKES